MAKARDLVMTCIIIGIAVYFVSENHSSSPSEPAAVPAPSSDALSVSGASPGTQNASPSIWDEMPAQEQKFISIIRSANNQYGNGANDMQKGAARPWRAQQLCDVFRSMFQINNWIGQVSELSSNGDGKGVLSLTLAPEITVGTWNNSLSDIMDNTLIDPKSSLFTKAAALKVGEWISFSGTFPRADVDCVKESSLTLDGSITSPNFVFQFSDVDALTASPAQK
jgi:hypothetical protein